MSEMKAQEDYFVPQILMQSVTEGLLFCLIYSLIDKILPKQKSSPDKGTNVTVLLFL